MSILLIGEQRFADHLQTTLSNHKLEALSTVCLKHAADLLKENFYKVIICAMPYGNYANEDLLIYLKTWAPDSNIIFVADDIRVSKAIDLVKKGLYSCVKKPFLIEDLIHQIKEAVKMSETEPEITKKETVKIPNSIFNGYVKGVSKPAQMMQEQIKLVAPTNFNVIIYGETGTGKESVAERLVAFRGDDSPFVAVDCGCLSRELAASELFGHEKGAFTGANNSKKGAFEQAHNGTLFLDEIGNLDYEVQTYLLRAIQERKIKKVGGDKEINIKVRIVVASNENLTEKVRKGEFREDLYHRLNEFEIVIPPLRERTEDLELFIKHFIREVNLDLNKNILGVDNEAFEILLSYDWPGNIRELKNTIRRACLLTTNDRYISKTVFTSEILHQNKQPKYLQEFSEEYEGDEIPVSAKSNNYLKKLLEKAELDQIMEVLRKVNYNKTKAASLLDIDRKTLYNKLKRMQLL